MPSLETNSLQLPFRNKVVPISFRSRGEKKRKAKSGGPDSNVWWGDGLNTDLAQAGGSQEDTLPLPGISEDSWVSYC